MDQPIATAAPPEPQAADQRLAVASQWRLMWWSFRRHRLAMIGGVIVLCLYVVAAIPGFFAINEPGRQNARAVFHPPQALHWFDTAEDGSWRFRPHVQAMRMVRDPVTLAPSFRPDGNRKIYLTFFAEGYEHHLFGLIPSTIHLLSPENPRDQVYPFGADRLGR